MDHADGVCGHWTADLSERGDLIPERPTKTETATTIEVTLPADILFDFDKSDIHPMRISRCTRSRPARHQGNVKSIEHQLNGECGGHRPADDAAAEGIDYHGEIEKVGACRET
jgi:hypothetical protein